MSAGFGGAAFGSAVLGTATSAETGGIVSLRFALAEPLPKTMLQVAFGLAVGTLTVAAVVPLLNAVTTSCPLARSSRETTSTAPFA